MKNQRIKNKPTTQSVKQADWVVVSPFEAEYAFRCWGGNTEYPHLKLTTNIEYAKTLSPASWIFIKPLKDHVKNVFDNFKYERMFEGRVGGAQNPGGNIFSLKQIELEYSKVCEELNIDMSFIDISEV